MMVWCGVLVLDRPPACEAGLWGGWEAEGAEGWPLGSLGREHPAELLVPLPVCPCLSVTEKEGKEEGLPCVILLRGSSYTLLCLVALSLPSPPGPALCPFETGPVLGLSSGNQAVSRRWWGDEILPPWTPRAGPSPQCHPGICL